MGFIEVVDTPVESAFSVAPGAEVFDVEVAGGENNRGFHQLGQCCRKELGPAIESSSKQDERAGAHELVLLVEIGLHDFGVLAEPALIFQCCSVDIGHRRLH